MVRKPVKYNRYAPKRRKRYKFNAGKFAVFFIALTAVAIVALIILLSNRGENVVPEVDIDDNGTFYEGVFVDSIALGGLTYQEGLEQVRQAALDALDSIDIKLTYDGSEWRFGAEDIEAASDAEQLVAEAYRAGREGTRREMKDEQERLLISPLVLRSSITYNLSGLRPRIEEIKEFVDVPAVNAEVYFTPGGESLFSYSPEAPGLSLDPDGVIAQIEEQIKNSFQLVVEMQPGAVQPEIFEEGLRNASNQIAEFSTSLGNSTENRKFNVAKSLAVFDGLILRPGEQLSFNETTGERSPENGYKDAPVIGENKQMVDGPGGGVCQTSTTLYNAALLADLKIVRRYHHSFPSSYVDKGFDATVNWPNLDLIIENNKSLPIFIHTYIHDNRVYVIIFGEPRSDGLTIKLENDVYRTEEPPEPRVASDTDAKYVRYEDEQYEEPSRTGYMVRAYKVYYRDGAEVDRVQINDDYYQPIPGTLYVGVSKRPEATQPPEETQPPDGGEEPPTEQPLPPVGTPSDDDVPDPTEEPDQEPADG